MNRNIYTYPRGRGETNPNIKKNTRQQPKRRINWGKITASAGVITALTLGGIAANPNTRNAVFKFSQQAVSTFSRYIQESRERARIEQEKIEMEEGWRFRNGKWEEYYPGDGWMNPVDRNKLEEQREKERLEEMRKENTSFARLQQKAEAEQREDEEARVNFWKMVNEGKRFPTAEIDCTTGFKPSTTLLGIKVGGKPTGKILTITDTGIAAAGPMETKADYQRWVPGVSFRSINNSGKTIWITSVSVSSDGENWRTTELKNPIKLRTGESGKIRWFPATPEQSNKGGRYSPVWSCDVQIEGYIVENGKKTPYVAKFRMADWVAFPGEKQ
ncbi:MAG: hypothetical protein QXP42_05140 [Candidatus Micrarchaeia archaeon]